MQTKKSEVKNKLLDAANDEFLEKGFDKASIRSIVKKAETTVGNFYNYFESKEMIFAELVDDVYIKFKAFIADHQDEDFNPNILKKLNIRVIRTAVKVGAKKMLPMFDDKFLLLIDNSEGTKYAGAKAELMEVLGKHFGEHIKEYSKKYKINEMGTIISKQLIEAIIYILKSTPDEKKREQLIVEEIVFIGLGIYYIMKG